MSRNGSGRRDPAALPPHKRRLIARAWEQYVSTVIRTGNTPLEVMAIKLAFYGGALGLFASVLNSFDEGDEITGDDKSMLEGVQDELEQFRETSRVGRA